MGVEAGREQQAGRHQSEDTVRHVDSKPGTVAVSTPTILESQLAAAHLLKKITANAQERTEIKPSLADILRAKAKASAPNAGDLSYPQQPVPQQEDTPPIPPDNYPPAVSYPKPESYSLADKLRAKAANVSLEAYKV